MDVSFENGFQIGSTSTVLSSEELVFREASIEILLDGLVVDLSSFSTFGFLAGLDKLLE